MWLYIECKNGFPFPPLVRSLEAWRHVGKRPNYSEYDQKFLEFVKNELGDDPKMQRKVFSIDSLLEYGSLDWCGMGNPGVKDRRNLLGLEDDDKYPAWRLHPNRVFFDECPICTAPNSTGCPTDRGRLLRMMCFILICDIQPYFPLRTLIV